MMRLPWLLMSGCSIWGGETMTFSCAFSIWIYSSKLMYIFLLLTLTDLSAGLAESMRGGVSSYHPPSGWPMRAHAAMTVRSTMAATAAKAQRLTGVNLLFIIVV